MSKFTMPVHWYMSAPARTIHRACTLNVLHHRFIKYSISSLAVTDDRDELVGVVSRTDLIRQSFSRREDNDSAPLLAIPALRTIDIMSPSPIVVSSNDSVAEAARIMSDNHIHRVYVVDSGHLAGVLSARDVLPAVVDLRLTEPLVRYMSTPLFVVPANDHISTATSFLETTQVSGVVALGKAGPLGVFTQAEALQCRNLPRSSPIADAMDTEILTLSEQTPLHRAVEEAVGLGVRRIVVTDKSGVRGIVTPLDILQATR